MIKNVRKKFTNFDMAWILINLIDHKIYDLRKYCFEKMRNLTLAYAVKKPKTMKMNFKNRNLVNTKLTHKNKNFRNKKRVLLQKPDYIKIQRHNWLKYTEKNLGYAKEHFNKNRYQN